MGGTLTSSNIANNLPIKLISGVIQAPTFIDFAFEYEGNIHCYGRFNSSISYISHKSITNFKTGDIVMPIKQINATHGGYRFITNGIMNNNALIYEGSRPYVGRSINIETDIYTNLPSLGGNTSYAQSVKIGNEIYFGEYSSGAIKISKIDLATTIKSDITSLDGLSKYNYFDGIGCDDLGNIYMLFTSSYNNYVTICKFDKENSVISKFLEIPIPSSCKLQTNTKYGVKIKDDKIYFMCGSNAIDTTGIYLTTSFMYDLQTKEIKWNILNNQCNANYFDIGVNCSTLNTRTEYYTQIFVIEFN